MPLTGHLEELRRRLRSIAIFLVIATLLAFSLSDKIRAQLAPADARLVFLSPPEALWADLKIAFVFGLFLSIPWLLTQAWRFVEPGLLAAEKGVVGALFLAASFFFYAGIAFGHFIALPFAISFLIRYGRAEGLSDLLSVSLYVDFYLKFLLAFGIAFEVPVAVAAAARLGLIRPETLARNRRYAILGAFVLAAILTPTPDIFNQMVMAVPLILLYEIGIAAARFFSLKPQERPSSAHSKGAT